MIPRLLHIIWVGDETLRPSRCIQTWVDHHPGWTVKLWGNEELLARNWINQEHIKAMAFREWNGVADMMRWEILFDEGGVLVDADSICLRTLPEWLLECEAFACWENELMRPGLVAAGYFGTVPRNPFLAALINDIKMKPTVTDKMAWETVGPLHLTETWKKHRYGNLSILPSHFFIPRHFTGVQYTGSGPIFAHQAWGSTLGIYDDLAGEAGAPSKREAIFLFEPQWAGAEWVEVLLSYCEAFKPDDPVLLLLVTDPAAPGQLPLAEAKAALSQILARANRPNTPEIRLVAEPSDVLEHLRRSPKATWVPKGPGNIEGLRGYFGTQLALARKRLTGNPA